MTDMESRETGKIAWETNVATKNEGPNISVFKEKVIVLT